MDWIRFGRGVRALRRRRHWRQRDLAAAVGSSQALVSRVELGHGDVVLPRTLEDLARALGARVVGYLDWNGEQLDRLLDAEHAALVEAIVRQLRAAGWDTLTERTFAIAGERGSVDVLAWHPTARALLVVEAKSVIADAQETLARLDRKRRLAARFAPEDWQPNSISTLLVVRETRTNRRRIANLEATFAAALPHRAIAVRSYLRAPGGPELRGGGGSEVRGGGSELRGGGSELRGGGSELRGLVFLSSSPGTSARHRVSRR